MRKLFAILFTIVVCGILLFACAKSAPEVTSETVIDCRYTPSYQGMETTYEYQFDLFSKETLRLMPNYHTKIYPDKYEVEYRRSYDNGRETTCWKEVTKDEYEEAKEFLDERR